MLTFNIQARKCCGCGDWGYHYTDYGGFYVCTPCEEEAIEEQELDYEAEVDAVVEAMCHYDKVY